MVFVIHVMEAGRVSSLQTLKEVLVTNAGVAGGLNDGAIYTADVKSFFPNGFGLYNMAGNVSEWVADVYSPLTLLDADDVATFRGNACKKMLVVDSTSGDPTTRFGRDSLGRIKYS